MFKSIITIFTLFVIVFEAFWGGIALANHPPKTPSVFIPEKLGRPIPEKKSTCERMIRIGNEVFSCDSAVATDAENLRSYLLNNPEAIKELDLYQSNRKKIRAGAYIGSAGLLFVLGNSVFSKLFYRQDPEKTKKQEALASTLRLTGLAVSVGTVLYGISFLKSNESHLNRAIDLYNEKNPNRKIEFLIQSHF